MPSGYQVLFTDNGLAYVWRDLLGTLSIGATMFGFSVVRFQRLFHHGTRHGGRSV